MVKKERVLYPVLVKNSMQSRSFNSKEKNLKVDVLEIEYFDLFAD